MCFVKEYFFYGMIKGKCEYFNRGMFWVYEKYVFMMFDVSKILDFRKIIIIGESVFEFFLDNVSDYDYYYY